jgi:uncharacterized membrane protein YdjX (TVP38/TMEM64 family)
VICCAGALLAVAGGAAFGSWRAGLAVAIGLVVGSVNGLLSSRALRAEASFRVTSLVRVIALSAVGLGLGALLSLQLVPLVLVGIGVAQLVLAGVAGFMAVRA